MESLIATATLSGFTPTESPAPVLGASAGARQAAVSKALANDMARLANLSRFACPQSGGDSIPLASTSAVGERFTRPLVPLRSPRVIS